MRRSDRKRLRRASETSRCDRERSAKERAAGRCPCKAVDIENPGPHIETCPWLDESYPGACPF